MKTFITTSTNSATGYELRIAHDDGVVEVLPIDKTYPNEPFTLVLPANPCNRKYFNSKKVDKANGAIELTAKENGVAKSKNDATKSPKVRKLSEIEAHLTEDELKVWNELKEKAERRAENDAEKTKMNAKIAKAKSKADKYQADYEKLLTEAQA